jgi:acetylornithine deacetylase/succinyl-diaminopimelate desuccinylase-like protein
MKSQVAAEVAAGATLARSGWRPAAGELLIAAVVDEETGGSLGAEWITKNHPEKVRCDLLINEGGGEHFEYRGRRFYGVCCAEKGVFRFTVVTDGVAGHASMPRIGDNALLKLAPLLEAMRDRQPAFDVTEAPRLLLAGLGVDADADAAAALETLRAADERLAAMVEPMLGVTLAPTRAFASEKINVIPSHAQIKVDCRTPPGMEEPQALARIREVLGDDGYRLEFDEQVVGNASPADTPLMDAIARWVRAADAEARVVPYMIPAFTDSRTFRAAFPDCVAYGFFPHRHMTIHDTWPLVHSKDERIDVRDLGFAAGFYRDIVKERLG